MEHLSPQHLPPLAAPSRTHQCGRRNQRQQAKKKQRKPPSSWVPPPASILWNSIAHTDLHETSVSLENLGGDLVTKWIRSIPSWHLQGKRWSARESAQLTMMTIFAGAFLLHNSLADASADGVNSCSLPTITEAFSSPNRRSNRLIIIDQAVF